MAADSPTPPPPQQSGTSWTAGRIVLVVLGSVLALLAAGLLAAGGTLLWVDLTQRDDDGFLTTPTERFESDSFAITSDSIDLLEGESDWLFSEGLLGEVRITGEDGDVFIGIGETADVEAYLDGVAHDEVRDLEFDPFRVEYRRFSGGEPSGPPTEQNFWAASASGSGTQSATWEAESGEWTIVVMNADASRGVSADVSAGAEANFLLWLAIGLLIAGALLLVGGVTLIVVGARGATTAAPAAAAVPAAAGVAAAEARPRPTVYPVALTGDLDPQLSRWLWVVKWLLAIPHYIVLAFLWLAFLVLWVVAFFAILFTGRYPRGIFDFNLGVLRWTWRVLFYSYWALGTDRYPPFSLQEEPDYPARLDIVYPERLSHWLPLVKWLLAIPHLILVGIFVGGWGWGWGGDYRGVGIAGLVGILVVIAGFVLLFTGRYPRSLFDFALGLDRWAFRVAAYVSLMRDEYPPFRLDMGPGEPAEPAESPPPAS
ncbi:MAG TPA: DUF4389 domain-containing protein [Gaiellaceae bacterium]|nr:DUF4389 domain-containing protein [Gaiellaceae bacterium]